LAALAPVAVALQLLGLAFPGAVESAYSRGMYPLLAAAVSAVTRGMPFALSEVLLAAAAMLLAAKTAFAIRDMIRRRRRPVNVLARSAALLATAGCALYGVFVLSWGLNHYRRSLAESAGLDASAPSPAELERLCQRLERDANRLRGAVGENDDGVFALEGGPRAALSRARDGFRSAGGRSGLPAGLRTTAPKAAALSPLMSALSIGGYYFPYTAEPVVNVDLPHCSIPHAACHEIAHHSGFASEDEANFIGYLACSEHPDADFRYSGVFTALVYSLGALRRADPGAHRRIADELDEGVKRDIEDLMEFWRRRQSTASSVAQGVNDAYLKTHGKGGGIASYGRFVDLLVARMRAG